MNLTWTLKFLSEKNLTVFMLEFHILVLLPNMTQILSLNNSLDHICYLVSPFSLPTLFFDGSALHINMVCQQIVTGSAESFVAGSAGNLVAGNAGNLVAGKAVHLAAAGGFGPGSIGNSSVVATVCLAIECTGYSVGGIEHFVVVGLANHHPSPLLCFYKWGNMVPIHISLLFALVPQYGMGDLCFMGLCLNFYFGGRCRCGGNWPVPSGLEQVFWCWPCFGPWNACSSWDILKWWGIVISWGTSLGGFSWNFPFAKFIIVIGMVMGICVVTLSALGVGACMDLVSTHTLYHLVGINFLIFSFVLVPLLTKGLVLGLMGLGWFWFCWGFGFCLGFGPSFPSNSRYVLINLMRDGCGWSLVLQGLHLIIWYILSLLNVWMPCIDVIFTLTSTVSTGKQHLKNPWRKLNLGCSMHAIWKIIYIVKFWSSYAFLYFRVINRVNTFSEFIYTASCMPATKVNHIIPCFSIRWKSKDFLFIICLILSLSWSLIKTTLAKSILLPLKVTVTSFHSISTVSHR